MISGFQQMQRSVFSKSRDHRTQQVERPEVVPCAAEKEHRDLNAFQVFGSFRGRTACGMKRKGKEYEPFHTLERPLALSMRRQSPAK